MVSRRCSRWLASRSLTSSRKPGSLHAELAQHLHSIHEELDAAGLLRQDETTAEPATTNVPPPTDRAAVKARVLQERANGNCVPSVKAAGDAGPVKEAVKETNPEQSEWERFLASNLPSLQCTAVLGLTR